jgi:hypothetical protein
MTPLSWEPVVVEMGVPRPSPLQRSPLCMVKYVPPCKSYSNGEEVLPYNCRLLPVGCKQYKYSVVPSLFQCIKAKNESRDVSQ